MTCRFHREVSSEGSVDSTCIACYARAAAEWIESELTPNEEFDVRDRASSCHTSQVMPALVDYLLEKILVHQRYWCLPNARAGTVQPGSAQNQER
jgi:hypothetical protein